MGAAGLDGGGRSTYLLADQPGPSAMMKIHPVVRRYVLPIPFLLMGAMSAGHQLQQWQAQQPPAAVTMAGLVSQGFAVSEAAPPALNGQLATHVYRLSKDGENWQCLEMVSLSASGGETRQYDRCEPQ